ncbi:MAG: hypothetical protein JHC40_02410 [Burkholderiales bacterium]|jgi:hypothetical protein|nr:hypothetical protein [Burkholderiales bacterium]
MIRMTQSPSPLQQPLCPRGSEAQPRFVMMNLADLEPLPTGPGWFDSSWELETGLEVCEGGALEPTLQSWFEAALREAAATRGPGIAPPPGNQVAPGNRSWTRPSGP